MKQLIAKLNLRELTNAYGMSTFCAVFYRCYISKILVASLTAETSPVSFQTTPADSITHRVETVGKVRPHVMARVVDLAGNIVPVNTPGELLVSGYLLQKGYGLLSHVPSIADLWRKATGVTRIRRTRSCAKTRTGDHGCIRETKLYWMVTAICGVRYLCHYL